MVKKRKYKAADSKHYLFRNLTRAQILSVISAPILSIASLVTYGIIYWPKIDGFYVALIVSVTVAIFLDRIARNHFENDIMSRIEEFQKSSADLTHIGNSIDGFEWFYRNHGNLRSVYNTVYRPIAGNVVQIAEEYNVYLSAIRRALEDGCVWHDLVCPSPEVPVLPIGKFIETLKEEHKYTYYAKELREVDIPLFQITVFEFNDDKWAVSFGWDYPRAKTPAENPRVFMSHDPYTVSYFKQYFDALWNHPKAHKIHEPEPRMPALDDGTAARGFIRGLLHRRVHAPGLLRITKGP